MPCFANSCSGASNNAGSEHSVESRSCLSKCVCPHHPSNVRAHPIVAAREKCRFGGRIGRLRIQPTHNANHAASSYDGCFSHALIKAERRGGTPDRCSQAFWRVRMTQQEAPLLHNDYVFGYSAEEYERLRRQAQTLEPITRRLFHAI